MLTWRSFVVESYTRRREGTVVKETRERELNDFVDELTLWKWKEIEILDDEKCENESY